MTCFTLTLKKYECRKEHHWFTKRALAETRSDTCCSHLPHNALAVEGLRDDRLCPLRNELQLFRRDSWLASYIWLIHVHTLVYVICIFLYSIDRERRKLLREQYARMNTKDETWRHYYCKNTLDLYFSVYWREILDRSRQIKLHTKQNEFHDDCNKSFFLWNNFNYNFSLRDSFASLKSSTLCCNTTSTIIVRYPWVVELSTNRDAEKEKRKNSPIRRSLRAHSKIQLHWIIRRAVALRCHPAQ